MGIPKFRAPPSFAIKICHAEATLSKVACWWVSCISSCEKKVEIGEVDNQRYSPSILLFRKETGQKVGYAFIRRGSLGGLRCLGAYCRSNSSTAWDSKHSGGSRTWGILAHGEQGRGVKRGARRHATNIFTRTLKRHQRRDQSEGRDKGQTHGFDIVLFHRASGLSCGVLQIRKNCEKTATSFPSRKSASYARISIYEC